MKFGRNLPQSQVPEWAGSYIDYKGLKKLIKNEAEKGKAEGDDAQPDTAAFFYALDRNLEDIDAFYNKKYSDSSRRLKLLQDQYGRSQQDPTILDRDEVEDLTNALLDLRGALRKLQWYGEVNRRGFVKITKKLDKKLGLPKGATQKPYNEAKVDLRPFAKDAPLLDLTATVNEWLSKLGEVTSDEDGGPSRIGLPLSRAPSRTKVNLPDGVGEKVDTAIRTDNAKDLAEFLKNAPGASQHPQDPVHNRLLLGLLSKAISKNAYKCITTLLGMTDSLDDKDDINQRNCLHRFLVSMSRSQQTETNGSTNGHTSNEARAAAQFITPAAPPIISTPYPTKESDNSNLTGTEDEAVKLLGFLLDSLKPSQRKALAARDSLGRTPLHLAALFGFAVMCQIIITKMKEWGQFEIDLGIHVPWLRDMENMTPVHLAVIGGHPLTTKALLDSLKGATLRSEFIKDPQTPKKFGECLAQAVQANYVDITEQLLDAGANINYQDEFGETAIHIASRLNKIEVLKTLVGDHPKMKPDLELHDKTFEWTPLFYACKEGHTEAVKLLLDAGADPAKPDPGGWTAQEHAALRGHLKIAALLNEHIQQGPPTTNGYGSASMEPVLKANKKKKDKAEALNGTNGAANGTTVKTEAVKTFGHRYLTNKSMILVSLGSVNTRNSNPAVDLKQIPVAEAHQTQLDTALSVVVTAEGAEGEPEVVDLPVQDNIATEPFTFTTSDASKTTLHFDIVPTYAGSPDKIIGRGSAILSSVKPNVGSGKMALQGDVSVPIHGAQSLKIIGTVSFNFLIIHPFSHPKMSLSERSTFWKKTTQAMVIGHRGLGKNMATRKNLQLGENTIQSFVSAANLGASYVEFDVQLTKDHVPIIYHDFLVSETGIDAPVHTLTLEQFLHINPERAHSPGPGHSGDSDKSSDDGLGHTTRGRAYSLGTETVNGFETSRMDERMKHTRDFKSKGFKANSRGKFIQEPFTTLEKMFRTLPKELSFNIEMKYPMLWESEDQEMDPYAVDLNVFVDTVLKMVYDLGSGRDVIFSSFNPDVCLLLAFKQPSIPVLFLTDAGSDSVGDIRASSLQEAIRFASRWDLLGIVSHALPFVLSPRLINLVKENGLMCISYGAQNNVATHVQLQEDEGIDAIITDDILQIKKARLTRAKNEAEARGTTIAIAAA